MHGVFTLDGTLGSHPIIQTVENPDQITEIFDTITYSKGSSLVRMLEDFLGETIFRAAVTNYLNEYKYKNAVTDNFFSEIDKLGLEYNVTAIMLTWTVQVGTLREIFLNVLRCFEYETFLRLGIDFKSTL